MNRSDQTTSPRPRRFRLPAHLRFLLQVYFAGLLCLMVPRLILMLQHPRELENVPFSVILQALWMGVRFDSVISGYLLLIPFVMMTGAAFLHRQGRALQGTVIIYLNAGYGLIFLLAAADIPFFNYFNSRLTISVLNWTDTPAFMAKIVFQNPAYYGYLLLFIFLCAAFLWMSRRIAGRTFSGGALRQPVRPAEFARLSGLTLLTALLLFVAIRGRLSAKSPIRWGTAAFSTYTFPNQLGLNPAFTFFRSWMDARRQAGKRLAFMPDSVAVEKVRSYLQVPETAAYPSPIARAVPAAGEFRPFNVVLVLMENMAAWKMGVFGNPDNLTPHLDSLSRQHSLLFTSFYSAGIHTFNGIYSTLFGFPALMGEHPMKGVEAMQPFGGLAATLWQHGYRTLFVTTHDEQFDNMGGFLANNGFEKIISQKDYPREAVLSTLGVPDHYMFDFALPELNRMHQTGRPFLAVFLTASDHGPYVIPQDIPFAPPPGEIKTQIVAYADWALGHFLAQGRRQPWFGQTVFVLVADHGTLNQPVYDLDLSYHHIPLIIHCASLIDSAITVDNLGGQIDVFPTIMGMLNFPYVNGSLGIDLLHERRPYIFFSADDKLGCLSRDFLWIFRRDRRESLHRYRQNDLRDAGEEAPGEAAAMKDYAQSMLQTTQWLISKRLIGNPLPAGKEGAPATR